MSAERHRYDKPLPPHLDQNEKVREEIEAARWADLAEVAAALEGESGQDPFGGVEHGVGAAEAAVKKDGSRA